MSKRRPILIIFTLMLLVMLTGALFIRYRIHRFESHIVAPDAVQTEDWPHPRVVIVFGASVYQDNLSRMLEDRVKTAIALYKAGKVDRILVSGDNRTPEYNEPKAMAQYLISHAVDSRHIIIDYAGRSTYETCLRAREIFAIKQALLVTQRTHLTRALYLANNLGINSIGVVADQGSYGSATFYQQLREVGASFKAFFNIHISPPPVILGEKMPVS